MDRIPLDALSAIFSSLDILSLLRIQLVSTTWYDLCWRNCTTLDFTTVPFFSFSLLKNIATRVTNTRNLKVEKITTEVFEYITQHFRALSRLNISFSHLTTLQPLTSLGHLTELRVAGGRVDGWFDRFDALPRLSVLDFEGTDLSIDDIGTLLVRHCPDVHTVVLGLAVDTHFQHIQKLQSLRVLGLNVTHYPLPTLEAFTNLEKLVLVNSTENLPKFPVPSLSHVAHTLRHLELDAMDVTNLPLSEFLNLENLKLVGVNGFDWKFPPNLSELCIYVAEETLPNWESIGKLPNLVTLDMEMEAWLSEGGEPLPTIEVHKLTQLTSLCLCHEYMDDHVTKNLPNHLTRLHLIGKYFSDISLHRISDLPLKILEINSDTTATPPGYAVTDRGLGFCTKLTSLEQFSLVAPLVTVEGCRALAGLKRLVELHVYECNIAPEEVLPYFGPLEGISYRKIKVDWEGNKKFCVM